MSQNFRIKAKRMKNTLLPVSCMGNNEQQLSVADDFTCPSEVVLFNGMCYFVHTSFVDNIQDGEHICHTQYSNSNLVKFDSHEWGNVNATQFLGRSLDDTLLEFFYYQLEKTLTLESTNNNNNNNNNNTNKKHWLRLLIGDKMQTNECVLRYFNRSFGAFTFFRSCNESGYPVCQSKTIRREIPKPILVSETINNISQTKNDSQVDFNTEPFITTSATETILPVSSNYTDLIISSNETILSQLKSPHSSPLRLITITGALLALIIFIVGSIFLGRYLRRSRGSYSTRSSIVGLSRRTKHSSTTRPSSDIPNTPAVLYARLQSSPPPTDTDMSVPFDNKLLIDGRVELLPISTNQTRNIQNSKIEEEEPLYATLKEHDEK
ncbi:unnamed protein product [Didymodactylos carnosus]|uniref:Uncharacterized protein n=1 Tax=Didymodactylos carnosus TaxID=1234261 RepID=A0A8S2V518_9BILA|nr:unnamed protein product [Didymodactylos carnosus]CAF4374665.1 unnamed protein product [Didymodactylos carnosus]